jgi:Ulp1 family protease
MIQERNDSLGKNYFINNTFFFIKLFNNNIYKYSNVKRWNKKINIFQKILITPINHNLNHWFSIVFDYEKKLFLIFDSIKQPKNKYEIYLFNFKRFLIDENTTKHNNNYILNFDDFQINIPNLPLQNTATDCGIFCLKYIERYTIEKEINFTQNDIDSIREELIIKIFEQKL